VISEQVALQLSRDKPAPTLDFLLNWPLYTLLESKKVERGVPSRSIIPIEND